MRPFTLFGTEMMVKGVKTFTVTGRWFDDQLVINFFNEVDWKEIDEKESTS